MFKACTESHLFGSEREREAEVRVASHPICTLNSEAEVWVSQVGLVVKNTPANAGAIRDAGLILASLVAQTVKNLPAMQKIQV